MSSSFTFSMATKSLPRIFPTLHPETVFTSLLIDNIAYVVINILEIFALDIILRNVYSYINE